MAESPFFGNVAYGLTYLLVGSAREFNSSLAGALRTAQAQNRLLRPGDEAGIVVITCVLKQIRTLKDGRRDVVLSSIFASGVGDGVIHYNRILDKNPAEPRAMFYSVLHRSVYSTAIFSCRGANTRGLYSCLTTLERFRKVELRRPKVNSVATFQEFVQASMPKMEKDLQQAKGTPQFPFVQRFVDRMKLMLEDAGEMLEHPEETVPKTYL